MRISSRIAATSTLALALTASSPAFAQTKPEEAYTRLEISGSGSVKAAPDQLIARFRAESRDKSAAAAQKAVNALVHKAVEQSGKATSVKAAVLQYSVSESHPDKTAPSSWIAWQSLTFTAPDGTDLLPLTGQLQGEGLMLEDLSWSLSSDNQKKLMLEAEKNAVEDLKKQADTLATSLGLHVLRFANVSIANNSFPRPMLMMAMPASGPGDSAPPPSSTAEVQTVRATASATVLLAP
nr:SIMPL domain-containing protein [uncultured Acetobacter sp.]